MSITTKWLRIMIIESHRLISVKPSGYSWSFAPIFQNDPMGFLGQSGHPPVPHDSWLLVALIEWPCEQTSVLSGWLLRILYEISDEKRVGK